MIDPILVGFLAVAFAFPYPQALRLGRESIESELRLLRNEESREYAMKYLAAGKGMRLLLHTKPVKSEEDFLKALAVRFDVRVYLHVQMILASVYYTWGESTATFRSQMNRPYCTLLLGL